MLISELMLQLGQVIHEHGDMQVYDVYNDEIKAKIEIIIKLKKDGTEESVEKYMTIAP